MIKYGYKQLLEGHKNHDCLECVKSAHKYGLEKGKMNFKLQVERITTENNLLLERLVDLEMRIEKLEKKGLK